LNEKLVKHRGLFDGRGRGDVVSLSAEGQESRPASKAAKSRIIDCPGESQVGFPDWLK